MFFVCWIKSLSRRGVASCNESGHAMEAKPGAENTGSRKPQPGPGLSPTPDPVLKTPFAEKTAADKPWARALDAPSTQLNPDGLFPQAGNKATV